MGVKASGRLLLVYSSLINIVHLKCSTTQNVLSQQTRGCFLVHSSLISIVWKILVQSAWEAAFCYELYMKFAMKCFAMNFIKLQ